MNHSDIFQESVMTDNQIIENEETEATPDELALLKERATLLGISFSHRIGVDSLREKIANKLAGTEEKEEEEAAPVALNKAQEAAKLRKELTADAMRLIRLRITNLNPSKKDLHGEIFTVANRYIGNVRKFIPYGEVTDNGYHVPNVIYKQMKTRKFLNVKTRRGKNGNIIVDQQWAPEFALEVLPTLTKEELAKLAAAQAAAGGA
jgi:hypothetical protein